MTTSQLEAAARDFLALMPFLGRALEQIVRLDDVTLVQLRVLVYLMETPMTLSTLARKRQVSLQSESTLVQGIVERGWVERVPDPQDRRQSLLTITALGRQESLHRFEQVVSMVLPYLARLTEEELVALSTTMTALRRAFGDEPQ